MMLRVRILLMVLFLSAIGVQGGYLMHLSSGGATQRAVAKGQTFSVAVDLESTSANLHNSIIFQLSFSSPGLIYQGYTWQPPFPNNSWEDDSKPKPDQLPTTLTEGTVSGAGYSMWEVDIELANLTADDLQGNARFFSTGRVAVLNFQVPSDYGGPDQLTISAANLSLMNGFDPVPTEAPQPFLLSIVTPPSATVQPKAQTVVAGAYVTWFVDVTGTPPFTFQWRFNGWPITDATNLFLTLPEAGTNAVGGYDLVVANAAGSVTSVVAQLTVLEPPMIVMPLSNLTVNAGATVTLAVTVSGTAPLYYEWFFNGDTGIASATNTHLTITNAQASDTGLYWVLVTNAAGADFSQAFLAVNRPPIAATLGLAATSIAPAFLSVDSLLFSLLDEDGDSLALESVTVSDRGGAVVITNAAIRYQAPAGFVGQDGFSYVVSDGRGGSSTGRVAVTVFPGQLPAQNHLLAATTGSVLVLRFSGVPGGTNYLDRSTDLKVWHRVCTNVAPLHGITEVTEPFRLGAGNFYRMTTGFK
jgi:hypothetical protein